jgi:hypothetical protein
MRALANGLVAAVLIGVPNPVASRVPAPIPVPVVTPAPTSSPDPCTVATAELTAAYAFYLSTILFCPIAYCLPLTSAAQDLVVFAVGNLLTACAF